TSAYDAPQLTSVADLTFLPASRRVFRRNVKSKATPENIQLLASLCSDACKSARREGIQASEAGHQPELSETSMSQVLSLAAAVEAAIRVRASGPVEKVSPLI